MSTIAHMEAVRALVEREYGSLTRDQFDLYAEQAFGNDCFTQDAHADAVRIIDWLDTIRAAGLPQRTIKATTRRKLPDGWPEAPGWWRDESARIVESWRPHAERVRSRFALAGPVSEDEAAAIILRELEGQRHSEDALGFEYVHDGLIHEALASQADTNGVIHASHSPIAPPLFLLAEMARGMSFSTGVELWEPVAFALCDVAPSLPWIHEWSYEGSTALHIIIGTPHVPRAEVARAYGLAARSMLSELEGRTRAKRSATAKDGELAELERFGHANGLTKRNAGQLLEVWNREYPQWARPSTRALYEAYRRRVREGSTR